MAALALLLAACATEQAAETVQPAGDAERLVTVYYPPT
jgi:hypothetical protein